MKRLVASLFIFGTFLTSCEGYGSPLGLNGERIHEGVVDRAMQNEEFVNDGYTARDIVLEKICAAIPKGEEEFNGDYLIYWKTRDAPTADYGGYYLFDMNEEDYLVTVRAGLLEEYDKIGCHVYSE